MQLPTSLTLLSTILLFLHLSHTIFAVPTPGRHRSRDDDDDDDEGDQDDDDDDNRSNNAPLTQCSFSSPPTLPPSTLPAPGAGLSLKHIVLGRGTQNYTCASATSAPAPAGAVATLFDVSCLVQNPQSRLQLTNYITPTLLSMPSSQMESFLASSIPNANAGSHFFRDGTTPIFMIDTDGSSIAAGKVAGSVAPPEARGNQNGAAVDWLKLARKPAELIDGIEEVYRVGTAGGRAPATCGMVGGMTVDYVAEYWMYG